MKAVLFDLDGTLLPMDQDAFVQLYFGQLAAKLAPHGYDPEKLVAAIWGGTKAMVKNDGSCTNEDAFWRYFASRFGEAARQDEPLFDAFYRHEFAQAQKACGYTEQANKLVQAAKEKGLRCALATNPIFPDIATSRRIEWAGLNKADFELYTTYENSRFCKPNPAYYQAILDQMGLKGEDCLMIGNDGAEDTAALQVGIRVFLLTDCLLNGDQVNLDAIPHGGFEDAIRFVQGL